jgi:hypothetical protein
MSMLKKRILDALSECKAESQKSNSFGYLPVVIETLEEMEKAISKPKKVREKMMSGFGRILTEDFKFSESPLPMISLSSEPMVV